MREEDTRMGEGGRKNAEEKKIMIRQVRDERTVDKGKGKKERMKGEEWRGEKQTNREEEEAIVKKGYERGRGLKGCG